MIIKTLKGGNMLNQKNINTLVVASSSLIRTLIKQILRKSGLKEYLFSSKGSDALKLIYNHEKTIDFIIIDWDTPIINGIELLKILKADPEKFTIPFLILSTENSLQQSIYAMEEGADYYASIPFTEKKLTIYIEGVIYNKINKNQLFINKITREKLLQNYDKAISLGSVFENNNNDPKLSFLLGECLYEKQKYDYAEILVKKSLENNVNSKALDLLGQIYAKKGDHKKSIDYFTEAKKVNPINIERSVNLANSFFLQGLKKRGIRVIDSLCESNKLSYLDIIKISELYIKHGFIDEVKPYLDPIVPIKETAYVFYAYTVKLVQRGEMEKGIKLLVKYIKTLPSEHLFLFHMGVLFLKNGNTNQAKLLFKEVLKLKPDYAPAKRCLDGCNTKKMHN